MKFERRQKGFILPTVLVLSVVLLTLGLSVFQLTSSIARSLTDQYWQRMSKQAAQAGISYVSACIDQGLSSSTWPTTITQDNTCLGNSMGTQPSLFTNASDTNPIPSKYKASFTIYKPTTGADGIPKARVVGTIDVLNTAGSTVIKSYTTDMTAIVNGPTRSSEEVAPTLDSTCALSDSQAFCWGGGSNGHLGNGSMSDSLLPVAVDTSGVLSGKAITKISAGYNHVCVIANGKAYCWGGGGYGDLGNNSTSDSAVPVAVDTSGVLNGKVVTDISSGYLHTCVIADGKPYCWGRNGNEGTLGNNSTVDSYVPVAVDTSGVLNGKVVSQIAAGNSHTCAIADGKAYCWGYNANGELGFGAYIVSGGSQLSRVPIAVNTSGVLNGKTITSIATGSRGSSNTCAIADGKAYCWGRNNYGQLGDNTTTERVSAVAVDTSGVLAGRVVTKISLGLYHTCAVADSRAYCWGYQRFGALGNGVSTLTGLPTPTAVDTSGVLSGKVVNDIATSNTGTCAIADKQVYCWGYNLTGQLGNYKTTDSSVPVKSINTF